MKKPLTVISSVVLSFCWIAVSAETPHSGLEMAVPESVGMSSDRLKRIDELMQRYIDADLVAGTVTIVARKGRVVHFNNLGLKDVAANEAMTTDTIFRMASMTKPIASAALMMLYEEGLFQLDDPISDWLPEFSDMMVQVDANTVGRGRLEPAKRSITFQHLLTHTAGFQNSYRGDPGAYAAIMAVTPPETLEPWTKRLASLPLRYHPGERWEYSAATSVVGRLVEVISGLSLDQYFKRRIFEPLDMRDTYFYLPESKLNRFASQYAPDSNNGNKITLADPGDANSRYFAGPRNFFSGAGGLVSTAADYLRFQQMMLNGGELDGVRLLGRKTVELMFKNHTGDLPLWLPGPGRGFGLGYSVVLDSAVANTTDTEGSVYWGGAFCTIFWIDPEEDLVAIMLAQLRPYTHINIRADFHNVVNGAIVD